LASLAIAGVSICMPPVYCDDVDSINEVRERFAPERLAYIDYLRHFVGECHERIIDGYYRDAIEYASYVTNNDLRVKLHDFQRAIKSSDQALLERLKIGLINGVPTIAQAITDPKKSAIKVAGHEILKILCRSIAQKSAEKEARDRLPMVSYIYSLKESPELR
jgi:hypothetical protein